MMLRSSTSLAVRSLAARQVASKRLLSSAKPNAGSAAKQMLPKNASMGLAVAGFAVFLATGVSGAASNPSHTEDAQLVAKPQADEAAQVAEVIAMINKRIDALEALIAEDRAAKEVAKQFEEKEQAARATAEAALAELKAQEAQTASLAELKQEVENLAEAAPSAESPAPAASEAALEPAEDLAAAAAAEAAAKAPVAEAVDRDAAIAAASAANRAFIFIKPHANTEQVDVLVRAKLAEQGMTIKSEGVLTAEEIDSRKLIDTHYGAIASKAVLQKPAELNVPAKGKQQFQEAFGQSWEDALANGAVLNAADACAKLGVNGDELEGLWRKIDKKSLIKFGGGFYCGQVQPGLYVINGFYMQMRGKYTTPPAAIRFYEVEWNPAALSWKAFRERFLGATDPTKAAEGSLRRKIYENWQQLGLTATPDTGDNGMHGSASPFEALAEVANWEGKDIETDTFGKGLLLASGLDKETLKVWLADAQVPVDGKPTSIFDTLEDQDSKENIEKLKEIVANLPAKVVQ